MAKKELASQEETKEKSNELRLIGFINSLKEELAKIVWPSRQQLLSESVAVILMVTLVASTIYLVDHLFAWIAGRVF